MSNKEIPVFLILGFLSSGKTKFTDEALRDERMNPRGSKTLLILCEDGEEEYDAKELSKYGVAIEEIESEDKLTEDRLRARLKRHGADKVFIEYNGMWELGTLYNALPEGWMIYSQTLFMDAETALIYNANMRQLVFDKFNNTDAVIFNRVPVGEDIMPYHKLVRGISRSIDIFYEYTDGSTKHDEIEDPLPFDVNAEVIKIEDRDFAIWFADMSENLGKYDGKTVEYLCMVAKQPDMPRGYLALGRHIMTCCADDIAYNGLAALGLKTDDYETYDWVKVTGKIKVESCPLYGGNAGPVLYVEKISVACEPDEPIASFY